MKQLKNYLILACRLFALTFLVLAFAQPYLPATSDLSDKNERALLIYVDNSFSMNKANGTSSLLADVKSAAIDMVDDLDNTKALYILTNEFNQSELNKLTKEEALNVLLDIDVSYHTRNLEEINNRLEEVLNENKESAMRAFLFSDFQKSQFPSFSAKLDSHISVSFVKLEETSLRNISIDTCWISRVSANLSSNDSLFIEVTNYSNEALKNHPVRIYINGQQVSLSTVDLNPWENRAFSIPLNLDTIGYYRCKISTTDDGIEEDDALFFSLIKDSLTRIYHLSDLGIDRFFSAVYNGSGEYKSDNVRNADIDFLNQANTFVLNGQKGLSDGLIKELKEKINDGANLILYPLDSSDHEELNKVLEALNLELFTTYFNEKLEISKVNTASNILKSAIKKMPENPIYPYSNGHYSLLEKASLPKENLLAFENGLTALRKYEVDKGNVFLYTFPLSEEYSNFIRHPLFVALSLNTAFFKRDGSSLYYVLDQNTHIPLDLGKLTSEIIHVVSNEIDVIPELKKIGNKSFVSLHEQLKVAGNYLIKNESNAVGLFSMNYQRSESDPRVYSKEDINENIAENTDQYDLFNTSEVGISASTLIGKPSQSLWKYCIILALMFFITETLIIKLMKA